MIGIKRYSPITFGATPQNREKRDDFEVVLKYHGEGDGPVLVDLSHRTKWDVQNRDLDRCRPLNLDIPASPGDSHCRKGLLINRMNRTQASIWHLGPGRIPSPAEPYFTDITDGQALLGLIGRDAPSLMEKISHLDLTYPRLKPPVLIQGPVLHIPSQVVLMGKADEAFGILIGFSRGYGQAMADAILNICRREGLTPGGEDRFNQWLAAWQGP